MYTGSTYCDRIKVASAGCSALASIAARMPSSAKVGGSRTSMIARSGWCSATMLSRPGPVSVDATTSMSTSWSRATSPSRSSA